MSPEQLKELTGATTKPAQRRWLEQNRYPHAVDAAGRPRVLVAYMQRRLGLIDELPRQAETEPDFSGSSFRDRN